MLDAAKTILSDAGLVAGDLPAWLLAVGVGLPMILVLLARRRAVRQRARAAQRPTATPSRGEWANRLRAAEGGAAPLPAPVQGGAEDGAARLQTVAATDFRARPLLSRSQARLLPILERIVYTRGDGHRLMAHTKLSDVVQPVPGHGTSPERLARALRAIQGLRLEFALFDRNGMLCAALEVQVPCVPGAARDIELALRREVLRKAGVPLHIVPASASDADLRALILPHLGSALAG